MLNFAGLLLPMEGIDDLSAFVASHILNPRSRSVQLQDSAKRATVASADLHALCQHAHQHFTSSPQFRNEQAEAGGKLAKDLVVAPPRRDGCEHPLMLTAA